MSTRWGFGALGWLLVVTLLFVAPSPASASRPLTTGLAAISDKWGFDHAARAKASIARDTVNWSATAPHRPVLPRNPADPAYNWTVTDDFVKNASRRGLTVLLTVYRAPAWAEGPGSQNARHDGTWKPDPGALEDFAHALATRYSGSYRPVPLKTKPLRLPRVRYYEAWTEPNLSQLLEPQWENGKPASPGIYRGLANAVSAGVKSVHSDNRVMGPGLAPYGDARGAKPGPNGPRMRPIYFLRDLFCLKGKKKLRHRKGCSAKTHLDLVSHHPINSSGAPTRHARNRDDASSADLGRVRKVVRAAVKTGSLLPKKPHQLWATETWWESKPPSGRGVPPKRQAQWMEQALYLFWKGGASAVIQQPLRDGTHPGSGYGGGLYFSDGKAKPALKAFRFPFVGNRHSKRKATAWGKAPKRGKLKIQRKHGKHGWKTVKRLRVRDGQVFQKRLKIRGKAKLRAKVGKSKSLVWKLKRK